MSSLSPLVPQRSDETRAIRIPYFLTFALAIHLPGENKFDGRRVTRTPHVYTCNRTINIHPIPFEIEISRGDWKTGRCNFTCGITRDPFYASVCTFSTDNGQTATLETSKCGAACVLHCDRASRTRHQMAAWTPILTAARRYPPSTPAFVG